MLVEHEHISDIDLLIHQNTEQPDLKAGVIVSQILFTLDELEDGVRRLLGSIKVTNWGLVPDRIALTREQYEASVEARSAARIAAGEDANVVRQDAEIVLTDSCYRRYVAQTEGSNAYKARRVEAAMRELDERAQIFSALTGQSLELTRTEKGEVALSPFRLLYPDGSLMLDFDEDGGLVIHCENGEVYSRYGTHAAPLVELIAKRSVPLSS